MPGSIQALRQQIASYVEDRSTFRNLRRRLTSEIIAPNASAADADLAALSGPALPTCPRHQPSLQD